MRGRVGRLTLLVTETVTVTVTVTVNEPKISQFMWQERLTLVARVWDHQGFDGG